MMNMWSLRAHLPTSIVAPTSSVAPAVLSWAMVPLIKFHQLSRIPQNSRCFSPAPPFPPAPPALFRWPWLNTLVILDVPHQGIEDGALLQGLIRQTRTNIHNTVHIHALPSHHFYRYLRCFVSIFWNGLKWTILGSFGYWFSL